ncbi:MAG: NrsF family protein, partial [Caulobacteraceae bacterium]
MDDLLDSLVADLKPVRRRTAWGDALPITLLCAAELALFLAMGSMRPDFFAALQRPALWWKLGGFGGLALLGMATAVRSFDPSISPKRGLAGIGAMVVAVLVLGVAVDLQQSHPHSMAMRLSWVGGVHCVVWMIVLSLPAFAMLTVLMRRGAPAYRRGTAWAAGVAAAAWGAFVFVFACPHDDPLYVA